MEMKSQPTRAAWIEITFDFYHLLLLVESQPTRAAWIEMERTIKYFDDDKSQPTRAAWIEIACKRTPVPAGRKVAAHSGCVD